MKKKNPRKNNPYCPTRHSFSDASKFLAWVLSAENYPFLVFIWCLTLCWFCVCWCCGFVVSKMTKLFHEETWMLLSRKTNECLGEGLKLGSLCSICHWVSGALCVEVSSHRPHEVVDSCLRVHTSHSPHTTPFLSKQMPWANYLWAWPSSILGMSPPLKCPPSVRGTVYVTANVQKGKANVGVLLNQQPG